MSQRYGIIDIGSNSIRLVIYEKSEQGAYRVVDGSKRSARLSSKITKQGELSQDGIIQLIETLSVFRLIAAKHHVLNIIPLATAAIRNASNQSEILTKVKDSTGFDIRILSGFEEASFGFLGMINALNIENGFLLDIGGGSSELTLFLNRSIVHSFSFPFGCVNFNKRYESSNGLSDELYEKLQAEVKAALSQHEWISQYRNLPLVAVGGTARSVAKVHQASIHYPLEQIHNYLLTAQDVQQLFHMLRTMVQDKRKKVAGLSKDRTDVIVPGLAIMTTIADYIESSQYIICGTGLRDGIFHKLFFPDQPIQQNPLAYSTDNIVALHTPALCDHVDHISRIATELVYFLLRDNNDIEQFALYVQTAAKLYRIGAAIDYSNYAKHTFYLIIHSHLSGLSHRELLLIASIASFRSKSKARTELRRYEGIIAAEDIEIICQLGTLLQLAIALDRSETQSLLEMMLMLEGDRLVISAHAAIGDLTLEKHEVADIAADFKKHWGVKPVFK